MFVPWKHTRPLWFSTSPGRALSVQGYPPGVGTLYVSKNQ